MCFPLTPFDPPSKPTQTRHLGPVLEGSFSQRSRVTEVRPTVQGSGLGGFGLGNKD